jgi:hypothetical protein
MACAFDQMTTDRDAIKFNSPIIRGYDRKFFVRDDLYLLFPFIMPAVKKGENLTREKFI